jgi:cytochrome P450
MPKSGACPYANVEALQQGFDHHSQFFRANSNEIFEQARQACPVFRSPAWGGFWVMTKYDDIRRVATDEVNFSSQPYVGQPGGDARFYPIDLDPPVATEMKRLMTPYFALDILEARGPIIRELAEEAVDAFIESGRCDFTQDFGMPVSGIHTLRMVGMDESRWREFVHLIHALVFQDGTPEQLEAMGKELESKLLGIVRAQRIDPKPGIISDLMKQRLQGEKLPDETIVSMVALLLVGGFDTTNGTFGMLLEHMQRDPELRKTLIAHPERRLDAIEETVRLGAPNTAVFRTVRHAVTVGDKQFLPGDRVGLFWGAGNRDEKYFTDPDKFILGRKPNLHMAFGLGAHRCLGSTLARISLLNWLDVVLTRVPDFQIELDKLELAPSIGGTRAYYRVPATFTPRSRRNSPKVAV